MRDAKGENKKLQKKELLRFMEGHKKANELTETERKIRLSLLTEDKSLQEYDALCNTWEANPVKEGMEMLEEQRISFLVDRRRRFDKAGGVRR